MARQKAEDAEHGDRDGDERSGCPGCADADRPDPEFANQRSIAGEVGAHRLLSSYAMPLFAETAVDAFALCARDAVVGLTEDHPARFMKEATPMARR
jgi:hypothetical protein